MAKTIGKQISKFIRKRWVWILVGAAVLLVAFFVFNGIANARAQLNSQWQTFAVERGTLTSNIGATGTVRAQQSAILIWGTSGEVEHVNAYIGQQVDAGEVLASLELSSLPQSVILAHIDLDTAQDAVDLEVAKAAQALAEARDVLDQAERDLYNLTHPGKTVDIDQAFANMVLAKDKLDDAREDYEPYANKPENNLPRANYLLRFTEAQQNYDAAVRKYNAYSGTSSDLNIAVAQSDVDVALAQVAIAQRDYDNALNAADPSYTSSAEAQLAAAQATLDLARVLAPFDGVITDAFPMIGDLVAAGQTAFQLDDLSRLLVDVEVSEVDINSVAEGQDVTLTFDAAPDKEYHGVVHSVALAGTSASGVVNFRVVVELTDADEFVRPAMTGAVNIISTQLDDVLLIPNRAVRLSDGQRTVYVLRNGIPEQIKVQLGASSESYSELLGGDVSEGDLIILNPPATSLFDQSNPPTGARQIFEGN